MNSDKHNRKSTSFRDRIDEIEMRFRNQFTTFPEFVAELEDYLMKTIRPYCVRNCLDDTLKMHEEYILKLKQAYEN